MTTTRSVEEVRVSLRAAVAYLQSLGRAPTVAERQGFLLLEDEIESSEFGVACDQISDREFRALAGELQGLYRLLRPDGEDLTESEKEKLVDRARYRLAAAAAALRDLRAAGINPAMVRASLESLNRAALEDAIRQYPYPTS